MTLSSKALFLISIFLLACMAKAQEVGPSKEEFEAAEFNKLIGKSLESEIEKIQPEFNGCTIIINKSPSVRDSYTVFKGKQSLNLHWLDPKTKLEVDSYIKNRLRIGAVDGDHDGDEAEGQSISLDFQGAKLRS